VYFGFSIRGRDIEVGMVSFVLGRALSFKFFFGGLFFVVFFWLFF